MYERVHGPVLRTSHRLTEFVGSPWSVGVLGVAAAVWIATGVVSDFGRAWELVGTVGLPVVALLTLFVVQHTQNHNDRALQLKVDELLRALSSADDRMVAIEDADEAGLRELSATYRAEIVAEDPDG